MNLLFLIIGISAAVEGGSRPDNVTLWEYERVDKGPWMNVTKPENITTPDYDYVSTLDMFDLLQGLLFRDQTHQVEIHNTTNQSVNQTFNNSSMENNTLNIVTLSVTILTAILNLITVFILSAVPKPMDKTYFAATTVDQLSE